MDQQESDIMKHSKPVVLGHADFGGELPTVLADQATRAVPADANASFGHLDFEKPNRVWVAHDLAQLALAPVIAASRSLLIVVLQGNAQTALQCLDLSAWAPFFEDKRLVVLVGGSAEDQADRLAALIDINLFEGWQPLVTPLVIDQDVDYFRVFYRTLAAKINVKSLFKATKIQTTYLFLRNALINAPLSYRDVPVAPFQNAQRNKPVLIVAAGPSLNKQLPVLAKYQHVFTILAVDTVWPILHKHGITPDMVFALDPRSKPSWPRDGVSDDTCFAVDIGCAPRLVWSHNKNHLFSSTSEQLRGLMLRLGAFADIIPTGGSVATSAFGFGRFMGGNPIVLIGQDLALTGGKDHADGYLHAYTDDFLKARMDRGFDVEGYYGEPVKTERQLLFYKTWYESQARQHPQTMVINATEGGAKIQGCLQIPFLDVCAELQALQVSKQFEFSRHALAFNAQHVARLRDNLDGLIARTRQFIDLAHEGEALIGKKGPRSQAKLLRQIDRINGQLGAFDDDARFVVDAFSQVEMTRISYQTVTDTQEKSLDTAISKYLQIYTGIQESGQVGLAMLQEVRQLYDRLIERGAYDLDLLDVLLPPPPSLA